MMRGTNAISNLVVRWREAAAMMRSFSPGSPEPNVIEHCATMLETVIREQDLEVLTLAEAAEESGYSYSALEKKLRSGALENAGSHGKPRVRRGDLPSKAPPRADARTEPDLAGEILVGRRRN